MNSKFLIALLFSIFLFSSCSSDDETIERSSEKDILKFEISDIDTKIEGEKILIYVDAAQSDLTFTPQITISNKASINPKSGEAIDFSTPVTFTVTAEDKSTKSYTSELVKNNNLSSEKDILKFEIPGIDTKIEGEIIYIYLEASNNIVSYKPEITISEKATISPEVGDLIHFTRDITFTVTAENKSTKNYTTRLVWKEGLKSIKLLVHENSRVREYSGVIDSKEKTITIDYYKDASAAYNKTLEIGLTEKATSNPQSGIAYTDELTEIKVNTENGEVAYRLIVRNLARGFKKFELPIEPVRNRRFHEVIDKYKEGLTDSDYCIFTLESSNLSNLVPVIELPEGATISPSASAAQDFSQNVTYRTTSESGVVSDVTIKVIKKKVLFTDEEIGGNTLVGQAFFAYYWGISKVKEVSLVNINTGDVIECNITSSKVLDKPYSFYMTLGAKTPATIGEIYYLRVALENGDIVDTDTRYKIE